MDWRRNDDRTDYLKICSLIPPPCRLSLPKTCTTGSSATAAFDCCLSLSHVFGDCRGVCVHAFVSMCLFVRWTRTLIDRDTSSEGDRVIQATHGQTDESNQIDRNWRNNCVSMYACTCVCIYVFMHACMWACVCLNALAYNSRMCVWAYFCI